MAKTIQFTEDDRKNYSVLTNILGLKDLDVVQEENHDEKGILYLYCTSRWDVALCPNCLQLSHKIHDYPKQRRIHDAPLRSQKVILVFDSVRFDCETCHKPFTQTIRDIVPDCTYTQRLYEEISDSRRKQDVATLAELYGIGYKTAESILLKAGEAKLAHRRDTPIEVEHLGIDEISNKKGHGDYVLVLTDLKRRIVLDILPDRQKKTLVQWLTSPPAGIVLTKLTFAATDLWKHYRDGVQSVFPRVAVVADRFHVVQNLHKVIDEARRKAQEAAKTEEEKKQLKGLRYLLLKNRQNLTEKDKKRLQKLAESHPNLYRLWELRQELHDWYEVRTIPEFAQVTLAQWIRAARQLGMEGLNKFCKTLESWHKEITNFFEHRITSGFVEGMNSKIRVLKRIAFGIPNYAHFRLRIIGFCG